MEELEDLRKYTQRTANEASFTYCKRAHKNKLYIGADFEGDNRGTPIGDCHKDLGKGERVGDAHSHPIGFDSPGITPSNEDIYGSMEDASKQKKPQINCITAPGADLVHCMEPKELPDRKKLRGYRNNPKNTLAINPYILDHFTNDFEVGLFDTKTGEKVENPEPKRIIRNTVGKARKHLSRQVRQMEYGIFCEYIQDVMNAAGDERVYDLCKTELRKKGLLDYLGIQ